MSSYKHPTRRLVAAIGVVALLGAGCSTAGERTSPEQTTLATSPDSSVPTVPITTSTSAMPNRGERELFGFGLSPQSYQGDDLPRFLDRITGNADVLMHAGDWGELDGTVFDVAESFARETGLDFVAVVSPNAAERMIRPLDDATRERYLASLRRFVAEQRPAFLGLGNEVNMLATDDPEAFETVVSLWEDARTIVRAESPDTVVFVTFQLEWLLGYRGGWFGRSTVEPQWDIVQRFTGADAIGFTTYPSLVFDDPADLPAEYYTQIGDRTDLPVIFTEIGWTTLDTLPLLPGSEAEQATFIDVFAAQTETLDTRLAVWAFVRADLVSQQPFRGMDLVRPDGTYRPAWQRWLDLRG